MTETTAHAVISFLAIAGIFLILAGIAIKVKIIFDKRKNKGIAI